MYSPTEVLHSLTACSQPVIGVSSTANMQYRTKNCITSLKISYNCK
jgi:hypothetical protein